MIGDRSGLRFKVLALPALLLASSCRPEAEGERDRGDIRIEWGPAPDAETGKLVMSLKQSAIMQNVVADLNGSLKLPRALPVLLGSCDAENAYYSRATGELTLCYELLSEIAQIAVRAGGSDEDAAQRLIATWLFVFFHELGHALIHLYDLPVTGREEDVVDNFSAVLLIQAGLANYAVRAAEYWVAEDEGAIDREDLAAAHSLDLQRFYNVLCAVYGSDPQNFVPLVTRGFVDEERAKSCPSEYRDSVDAWDRLLEPWAM